MYFKSLIISEVIISEVISYRNALVAAHFCSVSDFSVRTPLAEITGSSVEGTRWAILAVHICCAVREGCHRDGGVVRGAGIYGGVVAPSGTFRKELFALWEECVNKIYPTVMYTNNTVVCENIGSVGILECKDHFLPQRSWHRSRGPRSR